MWIQSAIVMNGFQKIFKKKKGYAETRVFFFFFFFFFFNFLKSRIENFYLEVGPYAKSFALFYFIYLFFVYIFLAIHHKKSWCAELVGRQTSRKIISTSEQFRFCSSIIYDEEYLSSRKISIVQYLLHFLMDISIFFLLLCLLQTLSLSSSNTLDNLRGTSLSVEKPSDKLVSENGEFSAGFFPVGDNAFCFAIWLNKSSLPQLFGWQTEMNLLMEEVQCFLFWQTASLY